jgi:cobalamin-dependent methionine synthase I
MKLYDEATQLLRQWADEPICHALFLLAEAYSEDDDIIVNGDKRLPFLRQQHAGKAGYTLCLSDFVKEASPEEREELDIANTIGVFATTVSLPSKELPTNNLQLSTLSDRLAEATAEKMHEEVRKHYWGYAKEENLTMQELHAERFQGIRPAVGYPSLPDQSINFLLDQLLDFKEIGITLSENGAMRPHCSVSGLMFAHPKAQYFAVGNISEEQLADYAQRRGIDSCQAKRFLASVIH